MAWEIESDFVDPELQVHRFVLVNPELPQAKKRTYDYLLGSGHNGQSCPCCHAPVRLGHVLGEDGNMRDPKGNEIAPRQMALDHLKELNAQQERVRTYVRKQGTKTVRINGQRS